MAKRLIRLFGFAIHDAPGEAEAECALLEQQGLVDAVLSEDVDTIMFGCRRTLRNWSAEGVKGSKTPTHVSVYDTGAVAAGPSGLDREGMVLVALMSGGDYLPEGVPGCGVKVACEAARAGFGRDLCRIKRADRAGLAAWKARLLHELRTNESGFFRTRHRALEIPENFPSMEILRYYTHPVVSRETTVERLRSEFPSASTVDVVGLREFTRETFDWAFRGGAVKLIRVLAPSLLVQQFLEKSVSPEVHHDNLDVQQKEESVLVKAISSRRAHFSTDATPELRLSFVPANVVKLNLDQEPEEEVEAFGRSGIALNSDDEFNEEAAEELGDEQPKSSSSRKPFDPLQPELIWIPETLAKLGVPLIVEDWEGKQRLKEQRVAAKGTRKTRAKTTDMPVGALDKYVKVTKNTLDTTPKDAPRLELASSPPRISSQSNPPAPRGRSKQSKKTSTSSQAKPPADVNPWTLASSQASPRAPKSFPSSPSQAQPKLSSAKEPIVLSSSPIAPTPPTAPGANVRDRLATPTKAKRVGPLMDDVPSPASLFSPSPSPRKQRFSAEDEPAEELGVAEAPPARKTRPFKRIKSGADDTTKAPNIQKSIKDFGRVSKNTSSSHTSTKGTIPNTQPIEILSDDEELPLPPLNKPPASAPRIFRQDTTHPRRKDFDLFSDDDPFTSPPPARHRTQTPNLPSTPADRPVPPSKDKPHQNPQSTAGDRNTANDYTAAATALGPIKPGTTAPPKTTKLYMPRTSLNGLGYFTEVEVSRDEADQLLAAHPGTDPSLESGREKGQGKGEGRRAWRLSDIHVYDLTGED